MPAQSRTTIQITLNTAQAQRLLKALGTTTQQTGNQMQNAFKKAGTAMRNFGVALRNVLPSLKAIHVAIAALVAVAARVVLGKLIKGFMDLADQAGRVQQTTLAFERLVQAIRNVNDEFASTYPTTQKFLSVLKEATYGTASLQQIMQTADKAITQFGDSIGMRLPEVMRIATAASLLQGKSFEQMVNAIVMGSGRLYNAYFQQLGLIIDLDTAYDAHLKKLNRVGGELSRAEKSQAALNVVLEQGKILVAAIGDAEGLLGMQVSSLRANFEDLKNNILNELAPAFTVILEAVNSLITEATPKIIDWVKGFVNQLAYIPPAIDTALGGMPDQVGGHVDNAEEAMGSRAANWAVNALSWGANVGSEFAIGILEGFTTVIVGVMNGINSILSGWLGPGSPPRVAPDLDKWGEEAAKIYLQGWENYTPEFKNLTWQLKLQLQKLPQQDLFQWGVDAIAEWAEGLSTFDLSFMQKKVEDELESAISARDKLTESLDKERQEMFRLQVLNKDPAAIRSKMAQVKATRKAKEEQEAEVRALEKKREEIASQLELFRLIERVVRSIESAQTKAAKKAAAKPKAGTGKGAEAAGGGLIDELMRGLEGVGSVTGNLEEKLKGLRTRLEEIFGEPFANLVTAFETNAGRIGTAWENLRGTLERAGILEFFQDPAWARTIGTLLGIAGAATILGAVFSAIISPIGLVILATLGLIKVSEVLSYLIAPHLASQLDFMGKSWMTLAYVSDVARKLIAIAVYGIGQTFIDIFGGVIPGFMLNLADFATTLNTVFGPALWGISPAMATVASQADLLRGAADKMTGRSADWKTKLNDWTVGYSTGMQDLITSNEGWAGSSRIAEDEFSGLDRQIKLFLANLRTDIDTNIPPTIEQFDSLGAVPASIQTGWETGFPGVSSVYGGFSTDVMEITNAIVDGEPLAQLAAIPGDVEAEWTRGWKKTEGPYAGFENNVMDITDDIIAGISEDRYPPFWENMTAQTTEGTEGMYTLFEESYNDIEDDTETSFRAINGELTTQLQTLVRTATTELGNLESVSSTKMASIVTIFETEAPKIVTAFTPVTVAFVAAKVAVDELNKVTLKPLKDMLKEYVPGITGLLGQITTAAYAALNALVAVKNWTDTHVIKVVAEWEKVSVPPPPPPPGVVGEGSDVAPGAVASNSMLSAATPKWPEPPGWWYYVTGSTSNAHRTLVKWLTGKLDFRVQPPVQAAWWSKKRPPRTGVASDMLGSMAATPPGSLSMPLGGGGSQGGNVIVQGPIVEQVIVPNMQVGRQVARDISYELGVMARNRRTPA